MKRRRRAGERRVVLAATIFLLLFSLLLCSTLPVVAAEQPYFVRINVTGLGDSCYLSYDPTRETMLLSSNTLRVVGLYELTPQVFTLIAGASGISGFADSSPPGTGSGTTARFGKPFGTTAIFTATSTKSVAWLVIDANFNCVKLINPEPPYTVTTVAGICGGTSTAPGRFFTPQGINQNVYRLDMELFVVGQTGPCAKKMVPVVKGNFSSWNITNLAGVCATEGKNLAADGNPLTSLVRRPEFVVWTSATVAVIAEAGGNITKMTFPTNFVFSDPGVISLMATLDLAGGHIDGMSIVPAFSTAGATILVINHEGGLNRTTFRVDIPLRNLTNFATLNFTIDQCAVSNDNVMTVAHKNGSLFQALRYAPSNLIRLEPGTSCNLAARPLSAYFGVLATETASHSLTQSHSLSDLNVSESHSRATSTGSATQEQSSSATLIATRTATASRTVVPSRSLSHEASATAALTATHNPTSSSPNNTQSHSHLATSSHSDPHNTLTRRLTRTATPPAPPPPTTTTVLNTTTAAPTTQAPQPQKTAIQSATNTIAAVALFSGAGAVAAQQARLNAVNKLVQCGDVDADVDEEPDMMSSPFKMRIGDAPYSYARGLVIGNVLFLLAVAAAIFVLGVVYATATAEKLSVALLRLRFPGILFLPALVFIPPTAQAATTLFWWGDDRVGDVSIALLCGGFVCFLPLGVAIYVSRQCTQGRVVLETQGVEHSRWLVKQCGEWVETTWWYKLINYMTDAEFEFVDNKNSSSGSNNNGCTDKAQYVAKLDAELDALLVVPELEHEEEQRVMQAAQRERDMRQLQQTAPASTAATATATSPSPTSSSPRQANLFAGVGGLSSSSSGDDDDAASESDGGNSNARNTSTATATAPAHMRMSKRGEDGILLFLSENPYFAGYGALFEDFSRPWFSAYDLFVALILGCTAGTAAGITTSFEACVICFSLDILLSLIHLGLLVYWSLCTQLTAVTPRFVSWYTITASFINFVAVVLAFAQFLAKFMNDFSEPWGYLALTQSILGMCAAILSFVGFVDFIYQLGDAYCIGGNSQKAAEKRMKQRRRQLKRMQRRLRSSIPPRQVVHQQEEDDDDAGGTRRGRRESIAFNIDLDLLMSGAGGDGIDIEAELAALSSSPPQHAPDNKDDALDLDAIMRELDAENQQQQLQEPHQKEPQPARPDLNHLLDDDNQEHDNSDMYKLDDEEDEEARRQRELKARLGQASKGNAEMEMNQAELRAMLAGGVPTKQQTGDSGYF